MRASAAEDDDGRKGSERSGPLPTGEGEKRPPAGWLARILDVAALVVGFAAVAAVAVGLLVILGAGPSAYEDVVQFGRAMVMDIPRDPNAPARWIRWLTGNADPHGGLPWPFGNTDYLVWWGGGSWPLWLATVPALARLVVRPTDGPRWLLAGWTLSAFAQVVLPGMYWQHYYLLPIPGVVLAVSLLLAEAVARARRPGGRGARGLWAVLAALLAMAVAATAGIQAWAYLGEKPVELAVKYKGGAQWVAMRSLGRVLARRAAAWTTNPRLYVWGWQSPLHFYSGLDSPTPHVFVNDLLQAHAADNHPLIRPRIERIVRDLRQRPPELIFVGYPAFPELRDFLIDRGYQRSRLGYMPPDGPGSADMRGLWVEPTRFDAFEDLASPGRSPAEPAPPAGPSARRRGPGAAERMAARRPIASDPLSWDDLSTEAIDAIEDRVEELMERQGIPGLSAAIVLDGRIRWSRGFGLADVENEVPATNQTVFRLASISKPIAAVAVLQLAERGAINLDAPIQQYVTAYPEKPWPVTCRQLLAHLGGVRHYRGDEMHSTWHYLGIRHALGIFLDDPLVHEPGTKFLYSTYGYALLGAAVQEVTDTRFAEYTRRHIFEPAGMDHARVDDVYAIIPHRAAGYTRLGGQLRNAGLADVSNRVPGSGFCATADDVARFAIAVEAGRLLGPEATEAMLATQATRDGKPTGYGLGWSVADRRGGLEAHHLGAMPKVSNVLLIRPADRAAVVFLSNLENQSAQLLTLAREVMDLIVADP